MDGKSATSVSTSTRRTFAQAAVQRLVASVTQESLPHTSPHALHQHRVRSAPSRCARQADCVRAFGRWMLLGGGSAQQSPESASVEPPRMMPVEQRIEDTRQLVRLLVQTRVQGIKSQSELAAAIQWTSRDLSNFMTGKSLLPRTLTLLLAGGRVVLYVYQYILPSRPP